MRTLKFNSHVDENGVLEIQNIQIPDYRDMELEILVVYQPVISKKRQWSDKVLSAHGVWQDDPMVRESQGEQTEREFLL